MPPCLSRVLQVLKMKQPFCRRSLFLGCHGGPLLSLWPVPGLQTRVVPGLQTRVVPGLQTHVATAGLHTSMPVPAKLRYHWLEIKKTPKPALILALFSSACFVTSPLLLCFFYHPMVPQAQVLHGACVLAFLGGVRWGYSLPESSPAMPGWGNLLTGALLPYMSLFCMLMRGKEEVAMAGLGLGFSISLVMDCCGVRDMGISPLTPLWYSWLRAGLTVIAIASFIATMFILNPTAANRNAPRRRRRHNA